MASIAKAKSGSAIYQGRSTVNIGNKKTFQNKDREGQFTDSLANIDKYDDRFKTPRYYSGDTPA